MNKRKIMGGGAAVASALIGAAAPAHAQRGGGPSAAISFSIEDRHDSNVARAGLSAARSRGLARGDSRATPSVNVSIARPFGRNTIALSASAGYDFYRRNKRLNRERLTLAGNIGLSAGACQLSLSPSFSRRQSDLADLAFLSGGGIRSVRNTETIQNYSGELRCGGAYSLRPVVTVGRSIGDNSTPIRQFSNYRSWRYGGGLGFNSPALGDITALITREESRYPDRPVVVGKSAYGSNRVQLSVKRELAAIVTGTASVSYISVDPRGASVRRFRGIGWNVGLSAVPTPDLRLTADLSRDVQPSLGTDALYQVGESFSLGASYAVSRGLSFGLTGSSSRRRFAGATGLYGPPLRNSAQRTVTGSVSASTTRRISVGADLSYTTRSANGALYDYHNFSAAIRASYSL